MIIFAYAGKFVDPNLGDKGLRVKCWRTQWRASLDADLIDATPNQRRLVGTSSGPAARSWTTTTTQRQGLRLEELPAGEVGARDGPGLHSKTGIVMEQPGARLQPDERARRDRARCAGALHILAGRDENSR